MYCGRRIGAPVARGIIRRTCAAGRPVSGLLGDIDGAKKEKVKERLRHEQHITYAFLLASSEEAAVIV